MALGGFRADYLSKSTTPVLHKLRQCGIQTPYLRPVYPSRSLPNLYTILTGLYPESHGIVNDEMFDPDLKAVFKGTESDGAWWGGEPIWKTAKEHGKRTASCNWAGSDVKISNSQPDLLCKGNEDSEAVFKTVVDWLTLADGQRPDVITVYLDEPGLTGRTSGPNSPEVYLKVKDVDTLLGKLMTRLESRGLDNCVNIMLLSDHGMSETLPIRHVTFDYLMNEEPAVSNMLRFDGTSGTIFTDYKHSGSDIVQNKDDISLEDAVESIVCQSAHVKVFTRQTIPVRHHYSNNHRIGDIILDVQEGWMLKPSSSKQFAKGASGYDEANEDMHGIFMALGPDLKQHMDVKPFESIEVYNLMTDLMGIKPAGNNGTQGSLNHLLKNSPRLEDDSTELKACEAAGRSRVSSCNCSDQVESLDLPNTLRKSTVPFGAPRREEVGVGQVCLLYGRQFTTVYSPADKQPALVSYELRKNEAQNFKYEEELCSNADNRLGDDVNPDCSEYVNDKKGIVGVHLYDHGFATTVDDVSEAFLSSNMVPMYQSFRADAWTFLWSLVKQYAVTYNVIHVSVGPIFDSDHDGKSDKKDANTFTYVKEDSKVPIPTHFFLTVMKCSSDDVDDIGDCKEDNLDILSFILPHTNTNNDCQDQEEYIKDHMARIRDIELLTGLRLLTKFPLAMAARLSTFIPSDLWPSVLLAHWVDLPCDEEDACDSDYKPLILISFDGFRAEYLDRKLTPNIEKLRQCGVRTHYLRSVFPTETYPNHHTIVTGLYPESHGIVENYIYDSKLNATFDEHTEMDGHWWGGEPIWVTAKNQGKQSASIMWIGSYVNDPSKDPSIMSKVGLKDSDTLQHGIEQLISWLTMREGKQRPDIITFYSWQPDENGHEFGPDSTQMDDELKHMDSILQALMDGLLRNNLHNCVNIIIVSDHGMTEESCSKQIALKDYLPEVDGMLSMLGTTGVLFPRFNETDQNTVVRNENAPSVKDVMAAFECRKHFRAYTKETMPVRFHYTNNERIGDVILDVDDAWMMRKQKSKTCGEGKGNHGYEPAFTNMRAIFGAHGPAFKQNFEAEPFENIELYNIMCDILGVEPAPNNGTVGSLEYILRAERTGNEDESPLYNIDHCEGEHTGRSNSCPCQNALPKVPAGQHQYHGGLALQYDSPSTCFLTNSLFATVYNKDRKQPSMVSFLVTSKQVTIHPVSPANCVVPDTKFSEEENPDCSNYKNELTNITRAHLYNPSYAMTSLEDQEVRLSSNLVPMYTGFHREIWNPINILLSHYAVRYKNVHVSVGPIFDKNYDGRMDDDNVQQQFVSASSRVPIPTHFFAIFLKCKTLGVLPDECDTKDLDILSFIVPHVDRIPNCSTSRAFLKKNVARLRDVELLTGLRFFTEVEWTLAARKRTFLASDLWSVD